jgi:hypothetical protein
MQSQSPFFSRLNKHIRFFDSEEYWYADVQFGFCPCLDLDPYDLGYWFGVMPKFKWKLCN